MSYIKLDRKILDWEWFGDPTTTHLWIYLLLKANIKNKSWQNIVVTKGQLVTSELRLSSETGLSRQQVRTALKKLVSTNEITKISTNNYTLITVNKWEEYQGSNQEDNQVSTSESTIQPTIHATITKEYKNTRNKEKEIYKESSRHKYGSYSNVLLSDEEMEKLKAEFPNDYENRIERVSEYCASTGKSYKNYLATIRNWARKDSPKPQTEERKVEQLWY